MNVTVADIVELMCSFLGFPHPTISWYHNGSMLHPNERIMISENDTEARTTESFMAILYTTSVDTGEYTCSGTNNPIAGATFTTPAWVLVQGRLVELITLSEHVQ